MKQAWTHFFQFTNLLEICSLTFLLYHQPREDRMYSQCSCLPYMEESRRDRPDTLMGQDHWTERFWKWNSSHRSSFCHHGWWQRGNSFFPWQMAWWPLLEKVLSSSRWPSSKKACISDMPWWSSWLFLLMVCSS